MITSTDFIASIGFLSEMLPMQRAMSEEALAMAWETFPIGAKMGFTPDSLAFAVKQRLLDPQPQKDVALHISLLRYVFPVERTIKKERGEEINCDRALIEAGIRSDLAERMSNPDKFHEVGPRRHDESKPPTIEYSKRITSGNSSRRSCIAAVEAIIKRGHDGLDFTNIQMMAGKEGYRVVLRGAAMLDITDSKNCVNGWIVRNPDEALRLAREADVTIEPEVLVMPQGDSITTEFI